MLIELKISNFAIIEKQSVLFGSGLNVITGETGAGKSIILSAIELLLGARPRAHFIRSGAESMEIEGCFDLSSISDAVLKELPEIARAKRLSIIRTLSQSGKSRVLINGKSANVSILESISQRIINICGQGQQMRLLDPRYHLECIDEYAGLTQEIQAFKKHYDNYLGLKKTLDEIRRSEVTRSERIEYLQLIIDELRPLEIRSGKRQDLESEIKRIEGGEKLLLGGEEVLDLLQGDVGVTKRLFDSISKLNEMSKWDDSLAKFIDELTSTRITMQELARELESYLSKVESDPERIEGLRESLAELSRLERKFKRDDSGLANLLSESIEELEIISKSGSMESLEAELSDMVEKLSLLSRDISDKRKKAATHLIESVHNDLVDVNMPDARIDIEFEEHEVSHKGIDQIEFLIASNKGEPFKPLRQVASGGELSRIMLVLKKNLRDRAGVNVLVFDEVDTGVSGKVARAVGEKLSSLSKGGQVICITHLPQIASLADHHLLVDKKVGDRALSVVREISGPQQVDEIARMLAGYTVTDATRESARELLASKKH